MFCGFLSKLIFFAATTPRLKSPGALSDRRKSGGSTEMSSQHVENTELKLNKEATKKRGDEMLICELNFEPKFECKFGLN